MEDRVRSPSTVREISWVEKFWPYEEMRERTRMHQKNEDYVTVPYSRVQLFPIQEFIRSVRLPKMVRPQFVCLGAFVIALSSIRSPSCSSQASRRSQEGIRQPRQEQGRQRQCANQAVSLLA
ncbi:hypothetical protein L596_022670 [Steinernema carpocapsae]|uniref:Uncharacterized protein n=1 Tax=Steinernema carpocapsae TaxID=34508 RepID=A0A4U5MMD8_STECR|nr:hypothetical protein L596_022670 [Steinernema carpocapsae]